MVHISKLKAKIKWLQELFSRFFLLCMKISGSECTSQHACLDFASVALQCMFYIPIVIHLQNSVIPIQIATILECKWSATRGTPLWCHMLNQQCDY